MQDIGSLVLLTIITLSTWVNHGWLLAPLLYLIAVLGALLLREGRERQRREFLQQIKSHRRELRAGGTVVVENLLLSYDTLLTTYRLTLGGGLSSITIPTPYRSAGALDHHEAFLYSLCSMFSGWWALPNGPMTTLATILQNVSGGEKQTVAELVDAPLLKRLVKTPPSSTPSQTETTKEPISGDEKFKTELHEKLRPTTAAEQLRRAAEFFDRRPEAPHPGRLPSQRAAIAKKLSAERKQGTAESGGSKLTEIKNLERREEPIRSIFFRFFRARPKS